MNARGFLFLAALLIVFVAMIYDTTAKKGSIWKALFHIFRFAESTSMYRQTSRTGA